MNRSLTMGLQEVEPELEARAVQALLNCCGGVR